LWSKLQLAAAALAGVRLISATSSITGVLTRQRSTAPYGHGSGSALSDLSQTQSRDHRERSIPRV